MKKLWSSIFATVLLLLSGVSYAVTFTDLKFGQAQIADSQWDVSACMYTTTCNIYSTNPGTMYKIPWWNGQWSWQSGQYLQFATTSDATNPYEGKVYNSNGSLAGTIGTGHIISMGTDSSGHNLFFFVGNDNNTGQLFSTNYGFSGYGGYTWTGTLNPTATQVNTFASTGSTTPLAAGQTGGGSSSPTVVSTSTTNSTTTNRVTTVTYDNTENKTRAKFGASGQVNSYTDSARSKVIQYDDTTTTTPTTTTTYSDGSTTSSVGAGSSSTVTSYDYDVSITRGIVATPMFTIFSGNSVYIDEKTASSNNNVTIEQSGPRNAIVGTNGLYATLSGQTNSLYMNQGSNSLPNLIQFSLTGNNNVLSTNQGYSAGATPATSIRNLSDSGGHIQYIDLNGNYNNVGIEQTNNGGNSSGHYMQSTIVGGSNFLTVKQNNDSSKEFYTDITGTSNNVSVTQKGTGQHYADISVYGNGNIISLTQDSSASKLATINATNAGGSNNISVSQTGSTSAGIVINQSCAAGTCGLTVTQVK
jgi:hypothetical protein